MADPLRAARPRPAATQPAQDAALGEWRARLGRKVSVRFRLHGDPAHDYSEAVGVVRSVGTSPGGRSEVSVTARSGATVSFLASDVTHVKVFD